MLCKTCTYYVLFVCLSVCLLLQPALLAYEWDRAVGCSFGSADFQLSVKRSVRKGEVFKAYPTCFSHIHIPSLLTSLRRAKAFKDVILGGKLGLGSRLAVRVRLVPYPHQLCALWIIVASCFQKEK